MSALTYKKNEDLESGTLDKMTVFQDCLSEFNAVPVQAKKCRILLAKLMHLLDLGESFPPTEATKLFFSISKLFQHKDNGLRQMVYLAIKELSSMAEDVLMVTSSIMRDIQISSDIIYKPNAIRTLSRVIDASTVHGIERLMKNCIVDKYPSISSAALVSSYHLVPIAKEVVRRWGNEIQENILLYKPFPAHLANSAYKLTSTSMTQYHAIGLLYVIRNHDKMALMKMIQQCFEASTGNVAAMPSRTKLMCSNAMVLLIRFIASIINDDAAMAPNLIPYLCFFLKHKSDMVNLEAAKCLLDCKYARPEHTAAAIDLLKLFLSSPRTVSRFSAVRLLNKFAMNHPQEVSVCNIDLESLLNDSNRSISTYAITTLLKTGNEASVDRLMKQISGFMNDISDEFKIIVVDAIRALALKFPAKHSLMLNFFATALRNEGGYNFKNAVVESLFDLIRYVPDSRDKALGHLCEFIEDCEYTELAVRVLHLLGDEGPHTSEPTMYIRHIYNRVVLENAIVRSAAVIALSKFALAGNASIEKSIKTLLKRCLDDEDDEVRDRASLCLSLISDEDKTDAKRFLTPEAKYSLPILEHKLAIYVSGDKASFVKPFDISEVPLITSEEAKQQTFQTKIRSTEVETQPDAATKDKNAALEQTVRQNLAQQQYAAGIASIDQFDGYGKILHSSEPVELTEKETEFVVTAVKHVFADHIVVQFNINNTLDDTILEDVSVVSTPQSEDVEEEFIVPIDSLPPQQSGIVYVSFARPAGYAQIPFSNVLTYTSKEIDPSSGEPEGEGYEDEYQVEDFSLTAGDYITPSFVGNFDFAWEELSGSPEAVETYNLPSLDSLAEAVTHMTNLLSMTPIDGTETPSSASSHKLKLLGKTLVGERVAAIVQMAYSSKNGVTLRVTARSQDAEIAQSVADCLA